jgi:hypothetical protein
MKSLEQNESKGFPIGVGGWLLFFCVSLTIIGPLFSFGILMDSWETAKPAFAYIPSLKTITSFELLGSVVIIVYGFVIGCKIWAGNPKGKWLAKQYLKVRFFGFIGIEAIVLLMMYLNKMPSSWMPGIIGGMIGRVIFGEGFFFLVWWFYFKKSKRVKNTYDRNTFIDPHGNNVSNSEIDRQTSDRKKSVSNKIHVADSIRSQQTKNVVSKSVMNDKARINISRNSQKPLGTLVLGEAEIKRTVYRLLLKEKKDEATMLQAKVECDGDLEKAEIRYYQLRYDQIVESGKINEIKKKLLAAKRKKAEEDEKTKQKQIRNEHYLIDQEKREWEKRKKLDAVVMGRDTGLFWFAGPDENIDWKRAITWIDNLNLGNSKWSMPSIAELKGLYNSKNFEGSDVDKLLQIVGRSSIRNPKSVWSDKTKGDSFAFYFDFKTGGTHSCDKNISGGLRVLAVSPQFEREDITNSSAIQHIDIDQARPKEADNKKFRDKKTGLEWLPGPDEDTKWSEAKGWINELKPDGWRMPTLKELESLYAENIGPRNMPHLIKTTGWYVWSNELKGSSKAWHFDFIDGTKHWTKVSDSYNARSFAVRS